MKSIVFDISSIITLATNNLLRLLEPLRKKFKGEFYIPYGVKYEIIDAPLKSRRFKLEAMQVLNQVAQGNLKIYEGDGKVKKLTHELTNLANKIYSARNKFIKVAHVGEISGIALATLFNSEALVVDERTTRILIEQPKYLVELLSTKLHTPVQINEKNLQAFQSKIKKLPILRSSELAILAYEIGLFDEVIKGSATYFTKPRKEFLDGLLWAIRLKGCAISTQEIQEYLKLEEFSR
ncbi:MAG: hypothetical protein KKB39_03445 [Nanoarchaeota archaeon]|nr:hypothetical protein [Nanoarchaeota archaeon]